MTGNELMSGDVLDTNSATIAQELKSIGVEVTRRVTVADDLQQLIKEINQISAQADILIINGGLGPTVDDMTAQALAKAVNRPLVQHPQAFAHLEHWCKHRHFELSQQNLKQAMLPENCHILANQIGSAVGFHLNHNQCDIFCTPGVPRELKPMLENEILPAIKIRIPNSLKVDICRFQVFGVGESSLQKLIDNNFPNWPEEIELGFRAAMPLVEVKLTTRNQSATELKGLWLDKLQKLLGDHIVGEVKDKAEPLAAQVLKLLKDKKYFITTAESCTGGLITSLLTQVAGASAAFEAGFITYSNKMKTELIGVKNETLNQHGAVSEAVVVEMAQGALKKSGADLAIAVSGIAGPDGGSADKPVGTVWLAWGSNEKILTQCLCIPGNRYYFQQQVAAIGLDLIRRFILNSTQEPMYIKTRGVPATKAKK